MIGAAQAGNLLADPVVMSIPEGSNEATLRLTNGGNKPLNASIEAQRWTQVGGRDRLNPTGELRISPSRIQLAAGASQFISIKPSKRSRETELPYRVFVTEDAPPGSGSVGFRIRLSLPVFVEQVGKAQHAPTFIRTNAGLQVSNDSSQHLAITAVSLIIEGEEQYATLPGVSYILPGISRTLPLPSDIERAPRYEKVTISTRQGEFSGSVKDVR